MSSAVSVHSTSVIIALLEKLVLSIQSVSSEKQLNVAEAAVNVQKISNLKTPFRQDYITNRYIQKAVEDFLV